MSNRKKKSLPKRCRNVWAIGFAIILMGFIMMLELVPISEMTSFSVTGIFFSIIGGAALLIVWIVLKAVKKGGIALLTPPRTNNNNQKT